MTFLTASHSHTCRDILKTGSAPVITPNSVFALTSECQKKTNFVLNCV